MQPLPNNATSTTARSQALTALIQQEYLLVIEGKPAQTLLHLLHDYQMNPFTSNIAQTPKLVQKYAIALLINGDYLQLSLLLARYQQKDANIPQRIILLQIIGQTGKRQELNQLGSAVQSYISSLGEGESKLRRRIRSATAANILAVLAKYYINVNFKDVQAIYSITDNDVNENEHQLREGFVFLRNQQVRKVDCLQDKLKQLAVVSNKMSLLQ